MQNEIWWRSKCKLSYSHLHKYNYATCMWHRWRFLKVFDSFFRWMRGYKYYASSETLYLLDFSNAENFFKCHLKHRYRSKNWETLLLLYASNISFFNFAKVNSSILRKEWYLRLNKVWHCDIRFTSELGNSEQSIMEDLDKGVCAGYAFGCMTIDASSLERFILWRSIQNSY